MRTIKFGIIGCGLMGREFASAAARWCHLPQMDIKPEIIAVCDTSPDLLKWYTANFSTITQTTSNYQDIIKNPDIDAVYIAVPHNLHQEFYCAAVEASKHLLGEKPFGIDKPASDAITACIHNHPDIFVRCSSQSIFFPAMQVIGQMIEADALGRIIELNTGLLHSSDLNADKPINWKRTLKFNGEYGCMGDLGMHACHLPFRAGYQPLNVRAILTDIVTERPDGKGGMAPCKTWDNATLFCQTRDPKTNTTFPWTIKTHRIAPGQKNNWYCEIYGTKASARWTSSDINTLHILEYTPGKPQAFQRIDMGHEMAYPSLTGAIFQAGFSDAILQMWAAFLYELQNKKPIRKFAACATPTEVALSHALFTAALKSQAENTVVKL